MAKSTKRKTKIRTGRPRSTGAGAPMVVRMHQPQLAAIDGWIGSSEISRPEAIRQLVTWALEHTKPKEQPLNLVRRARENEARRTT